MMHPCCSLSSSDHLSLAHADIEIAIQQRYMKSSSAAEYEISLHQLLAGHFMSLAGGKDGSFTGNNSRAFSELPYHLVSKL